MPRRCAVLLKLEIIYGYVNYGMFWMGKQNRKNRAEMPCNISNKECKSLIINEKVAIRHKCPNIGLY